MQKLNWNAIISYCKDADIMNIYDLLICPKCKCRLSDSLICESCKSIFVYKQGVYNIVSSELSSNQISLWHITDEMIENPDRFLRRKKQEDDWTKDYYARKNQETRDAEIKLEKFTISLLGNASGVVCDLATGIGGMLQKLLDLKNNIEIICTDIDPKILAWTRIVKQTNDHHVFYIATDGRYLSIKDNSFDYITSLAAFGNIPNSDRVARELYRVLKPNGKLIVQGQYIEKNSRSYEIARLHHLEKGLVEESLVACLYDAGFSNVDSTIIDRGNLGRESIRFNSCSR